MNGYSWQIKNTRLFLRLSSNDKSCALSLMMNYREAKDNCKVITSFIGSDPFDVGEQALRVCEELNTKCDFILDLLDKNEYTINEVNNWWYFPSKNHDVEADFLISFMTCMRFNDIEKMSIKLLHSNEKHNYCASIFIPNNVYVYALPNGIKVNAVDNLKINVFAIKLYIDKINKAVFENIMCDNDNPECEIDNVPFGSYSIKRVERV